MALHQAFIRSLFIYIFNRVYISTFNYYVLLHGRGGGVELFVLGWYECLWEFQLVRAYTYALCVSGALTIHSFVWQFLWTM